MGAPRITVLIFPYTFNINIIKRSPPFQSSRTSNGQEVRNISDSNTPLIWLCSTPNECSILQFDSVFGMVPTRLLFPSHTFCRQTQFPIVSGMVPVRALCSKEMKCSFGLANSSGGMLPSNVLCSTLSDTSCRQVTNGANDPENAFFRTEMLVNSGHCGSSASYRNCARQHKGQGVACWLPVQLTGNRFK